MDELAKYNRERWNALVAADFEYSRPYLNWTPVQALAWLREKRPFAHTTPEAIAGKEILCLANGGGQQSAVFSLLGARVTVFDLSDAQLAQDRLVAEHYQKRIRLEQGDMRDLSRFADHSFDIVYHEYSINFVPEARLVLDQVARVIRPGGIYYLGFANPFWTMEETDWTGAGYPLQQIYRTGSPMQYTEDDWDVTDRHGATRKVRGPHEYQHTLSTIINGLCENGFTITGMEELPQGNPDAEPGSWDHLCAVVPPFFRLGARMGEK